MKQQTKFRKVGVWAGIVSVVVTMLLAVSPLAYAGSPCGNAKIDDAEQCDDGNADAGDGCSDVCLIENGYQCTSPFIPLSEDNAVLDAGFEEGEGSNDWIDSSSVQLPNFCNLEDCPNGPGARFGAGWVQLGGVDSELWYIRQDVDIPVGYKYLRFSVQNVSCAEPKTPDFFYLTLNGVEVWTFTTDDPDCTGPVANYRTVTINLDDAPEGPYDGIGVVEVAFLGEPVTPETILAFDSVHISPTDGAPVPSICTLSESVQAFEPFEGISDILSPPDFEQVSIGSEELFWGTTDDGFCGNSGDLLPGNHTGQPGEAACIDSTSFGQSGGQLIESYFCLAPIDLRFRFETLLSLVVNYQPLEQTGADFFGVWASNEPFFGPIDSGADIAVFFANQPLGQFGQPPGFETVLDISFLDGEPEVYICFGYGNEGTGYAQLDTVILSSTNCTDDFEEDKLQSCLDNCSDVFNPFQRDSDNDGYGNACDGDIARNNSGLRVDGGNGNDCVTNFQDFFTFTQSMFTDTSSDTWNPDADFNGDDIVNFLDLAIFSEMFLNRPGPSGLSTACGVPKSP